MIPARSDDFLSIRETFKSAFSKESLLALLIAIAAVFGCLVFWMIIFFMGEASSQASFFDFMRAGLIIGGIFFVASFFFVGLPSLFTLHRTRRTGLQDYTKVVTQWLLAISLLTATAASFVFVHGTWEVKIKTFIFVGFALFSLIAIPVLFSAACYWALTIRPSKIERKELSSLSAWFVACNIHLLFFVGGYAFLVATDD